MATEKTDVVIVGVGAAGGIIAAELAKSGLRVIGLERGPRLLRVARPQIRSVGRHARARHHTLGAAPRGCG